jgi:hypothetical protein
MKLLFTNAFQHPVASFHLGLDILDALTSYNLAECQRIRYAAMENNRNNFNFVYFNLLFFFRYQTRRQNIQS